MRNNFHERARYTRSHVEAFGDDEENKESRSECGRGHGLGGALSGGAMQISRLHLEYDNPNAFLVATPRGSPVHPFTSAAGTFFHESSIASVDPPPDSVNKTPSKPNTTTQP